MRTDDRPFVRPALRLVGAILRRPARHDRSAVAPSLAARGQSLVEFSIVAVVLFPFLFALVIFMFNLAQSWSLGQAANNLGQEIITTGTFNVGDFVNDTNNLGFPVDPARDTLSIKVFDTNGDEISPPGGYTWDGGSAGDRSFTVSYGDLVTIKATKHLRLGEFAQGLVDLLPNTQISWSGIAQRDTTAEGVVNCSDIPTPPGCINTTAGNIHGTVRNAATDDPIDGVTIHFGAGITATSGANGRYFQGDLPPGRYTVTATKSGYQDATTAVTVVSGTGTVKDFSLESSAIVIVTLAPSSSAALVTTASGLTAVYDAGADAYRLIVTPGAVVIRVTWPDGTHGTANGDAPAGSTVFFNISPSPN